MESYAEILFDLRQLVRGSTAPVADKQAAIVRLRAKVPSPILAHFDRLVACGRSGVAIVRHGVCGECHMRQPVGTVASLKQPSDLYVCEHCGCYLLLAPDDVVAEPPPPVLAPVAKRRGRRSRLVATV